MPTPVNTKLYEFAKQIADNKYDKSSAYKSGFIVKTYKEFGGKYIDDDKPKNLKQWFKEDWKDIGGEKYPVLRPTKRVNKKTPLTADEIDPKNLKEQIALKQKIKGKKNLPRFIIRGGANGDDDEGQTDTEDNSDDEEQILAIPHYWNGQQWVPIPPNPPPPVLLEDEIIEGGKLSRDELKGLLDASYDGRAKVGDWTIDKQLSTKTSKVYSKGDRAVVAHRGTEGISDWGNNLAFAVGGEYLYKKTDRYKEAEAVQKKAEKKYGAKNVSTIGHSQGGLQAEMLGSKSKEIITLNKATHPLIKRHSGNQTDIRSDRDIVSIATKTPTTEIKAESYNPLKEHSPDILNRVSADTEYGSGLSKWSNPEQVKKNAIKYFGKNVVLKVSNKKGKKYMLLNPNTDKYIHFGAVGYEDFTKHQDPKRRDNYLNRSASIKGNWKNDKYSANNLARELLW